ncbi:MAG: ABC transporter permease [ANME-2 cluster archaeon]|nr:ABC transporter permease [ANME-2 cluster archaeon]
MGRGIGVVAKREGRMLLTEKTLVIAVLIQLFVASFSAFMSVGFAVMFSPGAISPYVAGHLSVGVVGMGSETSEDLVDLMGEHIRVKRFDTLWDAQAALREGRVDGVMNILDAPDDPTRPVRLDVFLPSVNFKSTLVSVQIKRALVQFQDELRRDRGISALEVDMPGEVKDVSKFFEFKYTVLVPLLILLPAFLSGGMIIDMITEEYELGTLDMLKASPLMFSDVIYGKMLVMVLIAPVQAAVWILLLELNRIHVEHPVEILLFLTLVTLILVQAGSLLSIYFKQRSAVHLVFSAVFVVLVLLSGLLPVPPLNLVALLAAGSGVGAWEYVWYVGAVVVLHGLIKVMPEMGE